MPDVHNLKTWTPVFNDVKRGVMQFAVRKNDRDYKVGDTLILEEFDPVTEKYKEAWIPEEVIYILDDPQFVKEGYIIMGLKEIIVDIKKK